MNLLSADRAFIIDFFENFYIDRGMILIYWKGKVGNGIAGLCDILDISYDMRDDSDEVDFSRYEFIIPSPGIPSSHDVYKTWKIKSELDFAYEFLPKSFHIVAVTGTDGKSTTSWILYELLRKEFGEEKVYLSGNFDTPFSETITQILEKKQKRWYIVIEVSSFMSYSLHLFRADYSVFTNFKPDHLNWHKDLQDYLDAKMNLIARTKITSVLNQQILIFADKSWLSLDVPKNSRVFSLQDGLSEKARDWTNGVDIVVSWRKKYSLSETHFSGLHNALNMLSVVLVLNEMKVCSKRVREYLKNITWLPHRIEFVTKKNWITYIDDSKSTSCQSLMAALTAFNKEKIILIAWGSDKGDAFEWLEDSLLGVKYCILIWATKDILAAKCKEAWVTYEKVDSMPDAVERAQWKAINWDIVLLSPGCASFWLFRDYLDRAEKFREAIKKLP